MVTNAEYTGKRRVGVIFRGCGVVVTHQLPKLRMRVRFPSAAFFISSRCLICGWIIAASFAAIGVVGRLGQRRLQERRRRLGSWC